MTTLIGSDFGKPGDPGVNFVDWDMTALQKGALAAMGNGSVTIDSAGAHYVLTGDDFAFVVTNGVTHLAAGTITGLAYYPAAGDGAAAVPGPLYSLSDFSMDVDAFNRFVATGNAGAFRHALFSGNDHLQGTNNGDALLGLRGNDHMSGGGGNDTLLAGGGRDVLSGGAGADVLGGGAGADRFVYRDAADSSRGSYDTIRLFNTHDDHFVVPEAVTGIDAGVDAGTGYASDIDAHLTAALNAGHLAAGHAALATMMVHAGPPPDAGGITHPLYLQETFLVVDVNGIAGYQSGEDLAIRIDGAHGLDQLSVDNFLAG